MPTLILITTSPDDVANLKADLPPHILQQLHEFPTSSPPAPAYPSIVHGSFSAREDSIGAQFSLFAPSRHMRVAVIPCGDAEIAALFAKDAKHPLLIVTGWRAGTGKMLMDHIERARQSNIPEAFKRWCSVLPHPTALTLVGEATHYLATQIQRANMNYRHLTLRTIANVLHRFWEFEMSGAAVLYVETSFDEALNPALAGSGLQGLLRSLVQDHRRWFDVVILSGSPDVEKIKRLNYPRTFSNWLTVILPEDCDASSHVVAASSTTHRPLPAYAHHPFMAGFALTPHQRTVVYGGERELHEEDKVELRAHMEKMRKRAAVGR